MNFIKSSLVALLLITGVTAAVVAMPDFVSANASQEVLRGANTADSGGGPSLTGAIDNIVNTLLFIIGIIAVLVIIIGGIMFATSAGDPSRAKRAKDTILYAVIGLVVAILAYAIVNFVVNAL
jgi:hypothetical protein